MSRHERVVSCAVEEPTGTCNTEAARIFQLAKKPERSLEYIVVHEMVHLLERLHNERFVGYMDRFLPNWRHLRDELNSYPIEDEHDRTD